MTVANAVANAAAGIVTVTIDSSGGSIGTWPSWSTQLKTAPVAILTASPRAVPGYIVFQMTSALKFNIGDVIQLSASAKTELAVVTGVTASSVSVQSTTVLSGTVQLRPLLAHDRSGQAYIETDLAVTEVFYNDAGTVRKLDVDTNAIGATSPALSGTRTATNDTHSAAIAIRFNLPLTAIGQRGYSIGPTASVPAQVVMAAPAVVGTHADPANTVTFLGKLPKGLAIGDVFALRGDTILQAATVKGVRTEADRFHVLFDALPADSSIPGLGFHGPMRATLLPENHDHGFDPALNGATVVLPGLPADAAALIDPGRVIILEDTTGALPPVLGTASIVIPAASSVTVTFAEDPSKFSGFLNGWTVFRGNAVLASHGENQGARVRGCSVPARGMSPSRPSTCPCET